MDSLFGAASGRSRRRRQVSLVVESAVGAGEAQAAGTDYAGSARARVRKI